GNGLGQVFLDFHNRAGARDDADYREKLRSFSGALDTCTEQAFGFALNKLGERFLRSPGDPLPVVPIVLGGDDMTVVMDGTFAVQFTIDFLTKFEELTGLDKTITEIKGGPVTACAG